MSQSEQVRRIIVRADTKGEQGLREMAKQFGFLNKEVKGISGSISQLKTVFGGLIAGFGIREFVNTLDTMQNLRTRIDQVSGGAEAGAEAMQGLLDVANRTKTSIDGVSTVYLRLANSLKDVNLSSSTLLITTEALQNTFRLSGATIQEATAVAIQLSQGLASGELRGQELRSVLEQNSEFGLILARSLGVTRGELYKLAMEGKLGASQVMKALVGDFERLREETDKLVPTMGQSLTTALNKAKVAMDNLNQAFGLSSGVSKVLEEISKRFEILAIVGIGALAAAITYKLLPALGALQLFFTTTLLTPMGGFLISLGAAVTLIVYMVDNFETLARGARQIGRDLQDFAAQVGIALLKFERFLLVGKNSSAERRKFFNDEISNLEGIINGNKGVRLIEETIFRRKQEQAKAEENGRLKKAQDEIDSLARNKKIRQEEEKKGMYIKALNRQYQAGTISVREYFNAIEDVQNAESKIAFLSGKKDLVGYQEDRFKNRAAALTREFNSGALSAEEFNRAIDNSTIEQLNFSLESGKITLQEYDESLNKIASQFAPGSVLRQGTNDYLQSIGTMAQGVAKVITDAFSRLEDALLESTKTGQLNFTAFTQSVLDDLTRIFIRAQILAPLAQGLGSVDWGNLFSSSSPAASTITAGGTMYAQPFASGGVVDSPSFFSFGSGKLGMAGEAGPEAILPLSRGANGDLGVSANLGASTVIVNNYSSSEVETREGVNSNGERTIEVLIHSTVKNGLANGTFDKSMSQSFGLKRRGL